MTYQGNFLKIALGIRLQVIFNMFRYSRIIEKTYSELREAYEKVHFVIMVNSKMPLAIFCKTLNVRCFSGFLISF